MSMRSSRSHAARATIAALALAGLTLGGFGAAAAAADAGTPTPASSNGGVLCDILGVLGLCPTTTATATTTATETATTTATVTTTATPTTVATETTTATNTITTTTTATTTATTTVTATPSDTSSGSASSTASGTASGTATDSSSPQATARPRPFTNITLTGLKIAKAKGRLTVSFTIDNTGTLPVGAVTVVAKASGYATKTWLVRLPVGLPVKLTATWRAHKPGKVRVLVQADPSNQLNESTKSDNTLSGTKVLR